MNMKLISRKTLLALTTAAVMSASSLGLADDKRGHDGWGKKFDQVEMQAKFEERLAKMKTELNLTAEQIALMEKGHATRMQGRKEMKAFHESLTDEQKADMKKLRKEMRKEMKKGKKGHKKHDRKMEEKSN